MQNGMPFLLMAACGLVLALVYLGCRRLPASLRRAAMVISLLALALAGTAVVVAECCPGPAGMHAYGPVVTLLRDISHLAGALSLLLLPLWLTVLLATFTPKWLAKRRRPALWVAVAGALLSPTGLFAAIIVGCALAGACL